MADARKGCGRERGLERRRYGGEVEEEDEGGGLLERGSFLFSHLRHDGGGKHQLPGILAW